MGGGYGEKGVAGRWGWGGDGEVVGVEGEGWGAVRGVENESRRKGRE